MAAELRISPDLSLPLEAATETFAILATDVVAFDGMRLGAAEIEWTLERIAARTELVNDCWLWRGWLKNGYGGISIRNKVRYIHRFSFTVASRAEPAAGLDVCHSCDTPPCWRPAHLFAGTRLVNMRDAWAKGRGSKPPIVAGMRHSKATLTDEEVVELRRIYAAGAADQRALASAYGVSQSTVWRIVHEHTRRTA